MKIILLADVKNVGKRNEIKEVSDGYAQNFLIKKKLAIVATPSAVAKIEQENAKKKEQLEISKENAKVLAEKLEGRIIEIRAKSKGGKLFGSITAKEIAANLKKEGFEIAEKSIESKQVKTTGQHELKISLASGVYAKILLKVEEL